MNPARRNLRVRFLEQFFSIVLCLSMVSEGFSLSPGHPVRDQIIKTTKDIRFSNTHREVRTTFKIRGGKSGIAEFKAHQADRGKSGEDWIGGDLILRFPDGHEATIHNAWPVRLFEIGVVSLRPDEEDIYFRTGDFNTGAYETHRIVNPAAMALVSFIAGPEDKSSTLVRTSTNFNDLRFKQEKQFLEKLAKE